MLLQFCNFIINFIKILLKFGSFKIDFINDNTFFAYSDFYYIFMHLITENFSKLKLPDTTFEIERMYK